MSADEVMKLNPQKTQTCSDYMISPMLNAIMNAKNTTTYLCNSNIKQAVQMIQLH